MLDSITLRRDVISDFTNTIESYIHDTDDFKFKTLVAFGYFEHTAEQLKGVGLWSQPKNVEPDEEESAAPDAFSQEFGE